MNLRDPVVLTPRLLPGVCIEDVFVSIEYAKRSADPHRTRYKYYIDLVEPFENDNLQSGAVPNQGLQRGLEDLLYFLSACGETQLFPPNVRAWAARNSEEISLIAMQLKDTPNLIEED